MFNQNDSQNNALPVLSAGSNELENLSTQRRILRDFVRAELKDGIDFGQIPGTPSPVLFQPGAQKLAGLFKLGSRIVGSSQEIDREHEFAIFTYRIELFHLPSGVAVAQCEASANSSESKHQRKKALDILNTLQKIAQKRAFVGAVIMATGASDFFSQDLEDEKPNPAPKAFPQSEAPGRGTARAQGPAAVGGSPERVKSPFDADRGGDFVVTFGKFKGRNFSSIPLEEAVGYSEWLMSRPNFDGKPMSRVAKEFIEACDARQQSEVDQFIDSLRPVQEDDVP